MTDDETAKIAALTMVGAHSTDYRTSRISTTIPAESRSDVFDANDCAASYTVVTTR